MQAIEFYKTLTTLQAYRYLLKRLKNYPSINRLGILQATREEFRQNKELTDPEKIEIEIRKARMGCQHTDYYINRSHQMMQNKIPFTQNIQSLNEGEKKPIIF